MSRLRVLAFIDSLAVGGAERSLVAIAPEYRDLGVDLHVAYLRDRIDLAGELESYGAIIYHVARRERRTAWVRGARRLIRDVDPDVVHTSLYNADIVGRTAAAFINVPVVSSFVTDSYGVEHVGNPEYRAWKVRAAQLVDLLSAKRVDRFHAVSRNAAELMSRRLQIPRDRIDVVPRGRDPEALGAWSVERRLAIRERIGVAPGVPLVLSVGRHYWVKGLDTAVGGFSRVIDAFPDAILYVAGPEGPATDELLSLARSAGIDSSIVLAGYRTDVADLLVAADVFVLSSRAEGSPGALIEAMALRTPAIVSDIRGALEMAGTPPAATVVPLDDRPALAEAIIRLLSDETLRSALADAAYRHFVENFTIDQVARNMMLVYAAPPGPGGEPSLENGSSRQDPSPAEVAVPRPPPVLSSCNLGSRDRPPCTLCSSGDWTGLRE